VFVCSRQALGSALAASPGTRAAVTSRPQSSAREGSAPGKTSAGDAYQPRAARRRLRPSAGFGSAVLHTRLRGLALASTRPSLQPPLPSAALSSAPGLLALPPCPAAPRAPHTHTPKLRLGIPSDPPAGEPGGLAVAGGSRNRCPSAVGSPVPRAVGAGCPGARGFCTGVRASPASPVPGGRQAARNPLGSRLPAALSLPFQTSESAPRSPQVMQTKNSKYYREEMGSVQHPKGTTATDAARQGRSWRAAWSSSSSPW